MSETPFSYDPYEAPSEPGYEPTPSSMPGGLRAIAIIAIILGGIGAPAALFGIVGLAIGDRLQSVFQPPAGMDAGPAAEFQKEMQDRVNAIGRRFMPASIVSVFSRLAVAVLLLTGGILVLMTKPKGRSILMVACMLGVLYEIGSSVVRILVQVESIRVIRELAGKMFADGPKGGPSPETLAQVVTVAMYVGVAFGTALALIKIVYYLISVFYLRKPADTPQFQP